MRNRPRRQLPPELAVAGGEHGSSWVAKAHGRPGLPPAGRAEDERMSRGGRWPKGPEERSRRGPGASTDERLCPLSLVKLEVEVQPGAVLELQGALAAVGPAARDDVGGQETEHLELPGQLLGVPHPAMPGFQGLAATRLRVDLRQPGTADQFSRVGHGRPFCWDWALPVGMSA